MELNLSNYKNQHSLKTKCGRLLWNVVWLILFHPTPSRVRLFNRWRKLLLRLFGAKLGKRSVVLSSCRIWQPWNLVVGDYSTLDERVECYSVDKIEIGSQCVVSQGTMLCCASHDITSPIMELTYKPIVIESQAWVAARAFIGPGVIIGEGAVVGACAVVTKDVEPWSVVAGNPARVIKKRVITE